MERQARFPGRDLMAALVHCRTTGLRCPSASLSRCAPGKGNTGFLFSTSDAAKEEAKLRAKGVKISRPVKKEEWGTTFRFLDPEGNEFQVIQD